MNIKAAVDMYLSYIKEHARPNTIRTFSYTISRFEEYFKERDVASIKEAEIIEFISHITKNCVLSTKNNRVGALKAFYNFIIEVTDADFQNPCSRPIMKKLYKNVRFSAPKLLEKDLIDEIIFRTTNTRNRLILELIGRFGMRIGEVLNMYQEDINIENSTILIREPKSGRVGELVYITKKLCTRLQLFIGKLNTPRVFNISYSTAYRMVKKSGLLVDSFLRPHDLRRHAATQASRSNIPLEVVSKVILRHADIATTQRYLGLISPNEARMWVEQLNR